jgi:hypothetical protein
MLQCRQCKGMNTIHDRYCVFCGQPLNGPFPWPMCGFSAQRVPNYPNSSRKLFPEQRYEFQSPSDVSDLSNLPQPVFAYNTLWYWSLAERSLSGLQIKSKTDQPWCEIQTAINSDISLSYASSLCFDGVFINGIIDGTFFRVSMYDGMAAVQIHDDAITVNQKTAPLISIYANPSDPYCPHRFFIAALESHVLVVDISKKGDEKYCLIPWDTADDGGQLRTPVQKGRFVYCLSSTGYLLRIDIGQPLESIKNDLDSEGSWMSFPRKIYLAPSIVGHYLVSEALSNISPSSRVKQNHSTWYERSVFAVSLKDMDRYNFQAVNDFHSQKNINTAGHLPPLSDGKKIYLQSNRGRAVLQCLPGKKPIKRSLRGLKSDKQLPEISIRNSLLVKDYLHVFDEERCIVHKFNLHQERWVSSFHLSTGKNLRLDRPLLFSHPIVFANIMALILADQIYYCDILRIQ